VFEEGKKQSRNVEIQVIFTGIRETRMVPKCVKIYLIRIIVVYVIRTKKKIFRTISNSNESEILFSYIIF
jgi:hypothetical protein